MAQSRARNQDLGLGLEVADDAIGHLTGAAGIPDPGGGAVVHLQQRALASEVVRREWRYARQQGRCVVPVIEISRVRTFCKVPPSTPTRVV